MERSFARRSSLAGGVLALAAALVLAAVAAGNASAATVKVCTSGCLYTTITDALAAAKGGDTIQIASGTYTGGFSINKNVNLQGAGGGETVIAGGAPVVTVASGATVKIERVTISGGTTPPADWHAAGVQNEGTLTLARTTVSGNSGIGITNWGPGVTGGSDPVGTLTAEDLTVTGNAVAGIDNLGRLTLRKGTVSDSGSGILAWGCHAAVTTIDHTTISGNIGGFGGGINNCGKLKVTNSTVSGNTADGSVESGGPGSGGGIWNFVDSEVTLVNTTVSGNTALGPAGGGGISNHGKMTLLNTRVTGNIAVAGTNGGGGILNGFEGGHVATLTLVRSDVSGNSTLLSSGGGISNDDVSTVTLDESTVQNNSAVAGRGGGVAEPRVPDDSEEHDQR